MGVIYRSQLQQPSAGDGVSACVASVACLEQLSNYLKFDLMDNLVTISPHKPHLPNI